MNTTESHAISGTGHWLTLEKIGERSLAESIGAVAAIILSTIGLAGVLAPAMAAIAAIVIGATLLTVGGINHTTAGQPAVPEAGEQPMVPVHRGVTAEFFGGLTGIVLGILAFFQTAPDILLACAVLVFGATLLLSGAQATQMVEVAPPSSGYLLIGLAAIVLGILAIIGLVPMTLILVGLLSLGAIELFRGSPLYAWMTTGAAK